MITLPRVLKNEGGVFRRALLHRPRLDMPCARGRRLAAEAAEDDRDEGAVHRLAHDVREDRAGGSDKGAGDDERQISQSEADARRRPARIEFSIETTTGMSAPPIGTMIKSPITKETMATSQKSSGFWLTTKSTTKTTSKTASRMLIAWRCGSRSARRTCVRRA